MKVEKEAEHLALAAGGAYVRRTKHGHLWRMPSGAIIGFSGSAGDRRALRNFRAELRRIINSTPDAEGTGNKP